MLKVGIIGGGACGLMCANRLLQEGVGLSIDIFERDSKVGKKILMSGNGRCNLTNLNINEEAYNNPKFMKSFLERCSANDLINEFEDLGVLTQADEEGRVYPISDSSNSVLDMLLARLNETNNVRLLVDNPVLDIDFKNGKYLVKSEKLSEQYDVLVIATGSDVHNKNKINPLVETLKIKKIEFTSFAPSLTPLVVKQDIRSLKGIRTKASICLQIDDKYYDSYGEVLFKENAISGIAAFELSSYLARTKVLDKSINTCRVELDLLPGMYTPIDLLRSRRNTLEGLPIEYFLRGMFNKMINQRIYKQADIDLKNRNCEDLSDDEIEDIGAAIKGLAFDINPKRNVEPAQVLAGGIKLSEISDDFESIKYNNLYLGGEILDIDGTCGGFNLHFAFSTGLLIAEAILRKI